MQVIVARCQNGFVLWRKLGLADADGAWKCLSDGFQLARPIEDVDIGPFLSSMSQHSVSVAGSLLQVAQLDL